jgi:hypothetical protein
MTVSAKRMMLMLFVSLQLADIATTSRALARQGVVEANPLMAWMQATMGDFWWFPKIGIAVIVAVVAYRSRRLWPMVVAIGFSAASVIANFLYV